MNTFYFFQTLFWFLLIISASVGVGNFILTKFVINFRTVINLDKLGTTIVVGLGTLGYASFILALLGRFDKENMLLITIIGCLMGVKYLFRIIKYINGWIFNYLSRRKYDWMSISILILTAIIGISLYLAAMQPPHATDELHYHFPEAKNIVTTGKVKWDFDGHYFYGNIPKLMEVIFSYGLIFGNYPLAHALNFAIMLSFLLIVFGIIKRRFGLKPAALSVLLIILFEDFTWNATVGFVDAATVSLEIGSLLYFIEWLEKQEFSSLRVSGILVGLAMSMKYSPLATALFCALIILGLDLKNKTKYILNYVFPALLFGGIWYLKNLFLYKNPFYPLYLGHVGIPEDVYLSLIEAIQQFGPKTISTFFKLIDHYRRYTEITVYGSIFLAPFAILIRKGSTFVRSLVLFYLAYIPYWFYSTHQIRFLMPAIIVALILTAILFAQFLNTRILFLTVIILLAIGLIWPNWALNVWHTYWNTKFHLIERQYALGNITETEYLTREFGCQYKVVDYLKSNNLRGNVIDNWSVWHDPSVSYFSDSNPFVIYAPDSRNVEVIKTELISRDISYLYLNTATKKRYLDNFDSVVEKTKPNKVFLDEAILPKSTLIFETSSCMLYKL